MLESIFVLVFIAAFLLFILAIERKNALFTFTNAMLFAILALQALYVQIPFVVATNATNYTKGWQISQEIGLSVFCWAFVFVDIVVGVILFMEWQEKRAGPGAGILPPTR